MTIHSRYIGILALLFGITTLSYGQVAPELSQNRAVLRYMSSIDVEGIEAQNPEQFLNLKYYFTESFSVSSLNPSQPVNLLEFYNYDLFNIKNFEHLRQQSEELEFNYKDKYVVVLKSLDDVQGEMTLGYDEILNKPFRHLPVYVNTGNPSEDYFNYKRELSVWANDFPELYREITSIRNVTKIRHQDFINMSSERINYYSLRPSSYIIID